MVLDSLRTKYTTQKNHAKERGIEFNLSYDEWIKWWGEDIKLRGRGMGKLQMCRIKDQGDYSIGNIFKSTHEQNQKDKITNGTHKARPMSLTLDFIEIINYLLPFNSTRTIARNMGTSQRTVMRVKLQKDSYAIH